MYYFKAKLFLWIFIIGWFFIVIHIFVNFFVIKFQHIYTIANSNIMQKIYNTNRNYKNK